MGGAEAGCRVQQRRREQALLLHRAQRRQAALGCGRLVLRQPGGRCVLGARALHLRQPCGGQGHCGHAAQAPAGDVLRHALQWAGILLRGACPAALLRGVCPAALLRGAAVTLAAIAVAPGHHILVVPPVRLRQPADEGVGGGASGQRLLAVGLRGAAGEGGRGAGLGCSERRGQLLWRPYGGEPQRAVQPRLWERAGPVGRAGQREQAQVFTILAARKVGSWAAVGSAPSICARSSA